MQLPYFVRLKDGVVELATTRPDLFPLNPLDRSEADVPVNSAADNPFNGPDGLPDYRRLRREMFLREIACGPLALVAMLQSFGVPLTTEQSESLVAEAGGHGIDLLRLKELSETFGLHALGVSVTPAKLRAMKQKAIVHLDGVGYAALTGFTRDGFRVVFPLQPPGLLTDDLFERSFGKTGYALLLSRSPLDATALGLDPPPTGSPQGPHLHLSRGVLAAGRLHTYDWKAEITLTNVGTAALILEELKPSCLDCFKIQVAKTTLIPGESTLLAIHGTENFLGSFSYALFVKTNQPGQETVRIPVRGYIEQPVGFANPTQFWQGLVPREAARVEVPLDLPPTLALERLKVLVPTGAPIVATLPRDVVRGPLLTVAWQGSENVGTERYQLDIVLEGEAKPVKAPFHVAAEIVPSISIVPTSALVREEELAGAWSRQFICRPRRPVNGAPKLAWTTPRWAEVLAAEVKEETGGAWIVMVQPKTAGGVQPRGWAEPEISYEPAFRERLVVLFGGLGLAGDHSRVPLRAP